MVAIVGASGVGKSTLLHLLGGLDRADSGEIVVADTESAGPRRRALVQFRNRNVGFVFQFHHLMPEFDAAENVEMPMRIARAAAGRRAPSSRDRSPVRESGWRASEAPAERDVGR